jgi:hypothetical protein
MHGRDAATSLSLWTGCDVRNTLRHMRTDWRYVVSKLLNAASAWGIGQDGGRLAGRARARRAVTYDGAGEDRDVCGVDGTPPDCLRVNEFCKSVVPYGEAPWN